MIRLVLFPYHSEHYTLKKDKIDKESNLNPNNRDTHKPND